MEILTLKTVLVGIDLDDSALVALRAGKTLAEAAGAKLHVVHVSNTDVTAAVSETLKRGDIQPGEAPIHNIRGEPAIEISELGREIDADVIVVGPHRERAHARGTREPGSTALAVVTNATAPCLVLGQPLHVPLRCVVAAVDGSETARGALVVGLAWASALRAPGRVAKHPTKLVAIHVQHPGEPGEPAALDAELELIHQDAGAWAGVVIERQVVASSSAVEGIAECVKAHDADLLVLGTRGGGLNGVTRLGSVSGEVIQRLELPKLLVPPAVWTTYVGNALRQSEHNG